MTQVVGEFRRALDALALGAAPAASGLKDSTEGGRETYGAYHRGWR